MTKTKKILSAILCFAMVLCLSVGVMPFVNANEVHAETPDTLILGNLDNETETFNDATGSGEGTYQYFAIYFVETMGTGDSINLPTVSGYSANETNPYAITVVINPAQTAQAIAENYISKIRFNFANQQTVQVVLMKNVPPAGLFFNALNEHYYQFVEFNDGKDKHHWIDAYNAAKGMTFDDRTGYLATITSLEEDLLVYNASKKVGFLGGTVLSHGNEIGNLHYDFTVDNNSNYDKSTMKTWYWACGPERGQTFFKASDNDTLNDDYAYGYNKNLNYYFNWNNNEPNGSSEDNPSNECCLTTLAVGAGYATKTAGISEYSWNDMPENATSDFPGAQAYAVKGYFVEFGDQVDGDSHASSNLSATGYIGYSTTQVDEEYYKTLKDAIENIENNKEIALLANNTEKFDINRAISFVIDTNGYSFNTSNITAGTGYKFTTQTNGNKITFTVIHSHNNIDFTNVWGDEESAWTNNNSLPENAGNYFLTCDVTLSETWTVPAGTTNLCLNGHVINADTSEEDFCVIKIQSGATLNLYDCGTTVHNGYVDANGLWHLDANKEHQLGDNETAKTITGGIITGGNNSNPGNGGGVQVDKGEFNMYGGNIVGNYAKNGAGIQVSSAMEGVIASFNMSGGTISYNNALNTGGGVFTQSDITLGGIAKITENTAIGATNNVYLFTDKTITLGTGTGEEGNGVAVPTEEMNVGITLQKSTDKFATNCTTNDKKYFFSDNNNYYVNFNAGADGTGDGYLELKEKNKITPSVSLTGWTYGEAANNPSVTGNIGQGAVTFTYKDAADDTYTTERPTKAGTYVVKAEIAETNDYQAGSATSEFTISQKQLTVTGTTVKDKTYDGNITTTIKEKGTLNGVVGSDVVIFDATATYNDANAGNNKSVTVTYTISGEDASNYIAPVDNTSLTSTISQAEVVKPQKDTTIFTYDGTEKTYVVTTNELYKIENNKATNAGTYNVTVSLKDKINYKWEDSSSNDLSYEFIINKADMVIGTNITAPSVPTSDLTYDGNPKELLCSGLTYDEKDGVTPFGTFYYSIDGTDWSTDLPKAISAGEYNPLWYFVGGDNHNNVGSKEEPISQLYPVVISSSGSLTLSDITNQVYTGNEIKPTITINGLVSGEELTLDTDYTVSYTDNINAGTAKATITLLDTDKAKNYEFAENANIVTFTITPKPLTNDALTITGTYTYTGSPITPTYTVKDGNKELVKDTDYTAELTNNTNASETTPTVTITLKGNYTGTLTKTFAINKAPITPAVSLNSWTQGESAKEPSVTSNPGNGEITYEYKVKDADDSTYTNEKPSQAGKYTVKATIAKTDNYLGGNATSDFIIFNSSTTSEGKIETAVVNTNTEINDAKLEGISESEAKTIVNVDSDLVDLKEAINNGKKVIIYTEVEKPSEESEQAFTSMNINETNAVILDINLYGEIVGEANSKKKISDTNGYKTTISITLTAEQAQKINIASNKNYYVLRKHANKIVKIPATLTTDASGNYVFTFETDKFSAYAIYSENKPAPTPDSKPRYKVPNTGVDVTPTSNHSLLKLSSLSLLAVGTYIVIKKKKDND